MPSPLTSTFASAAAGNQQESRREGSGGGEWTRTRTNGATQTFRRPSAATTPSANREDGASQSASTYVPPHSNSVFAGNIRNGIVGGENRYNKDQLLSIYKTQKHSGDLGRNLSNIFLGGWNPSDSKSYQQASWGRKDDAKESSTGPEICWDHDGRMSPLGLLAMDDEERDLFSTSVNSPLKPPQQSGPKESAQVGSSGSRKLSINQSQLNSFHGASPGSGKPGPRRRETGESIAGANPLSPTGGGRFFRDEPMATPPASLLRRKTDFKENSSDSKAEQDTPPRESSAETGTPFGGSLRRTTTGPLSAGVNAPSSPWSTGPQSAGLSAMGTFGNFSLGSNAPNVDSAEKRTGYGSLRESRFKSIIQKTSTEDLSPSVKEKSSFGALGRVPETEGTSVHTLWDDPKKTRQGRSDTNPYGDEVPRTGSAALGGSDDSPPIASTAARQPYGSQTRHFADDPLSPTDTNPYASPDADRIEINRPDADNFRTSANNLPPFNQLREGSMRSPFGTERRDMSSAFEDLTSTTSSGPNRGFPSLGGLGGLGGLGSGPWTSATPTKERSAFSGFGEGIFGSMNDLQSPNSSGMGGSAFFGAPGVLGTSRPAKMSSLFPPAMQEQMRGDKSRIDRGGESLDYPGDLAFNAVGNRIETTAFRRDVDPAFKNTGGLFRDFETGEPGSRGPLSSEDLPFMSQPSQPFGAHANRHIASPDDISLSQIGGHASDSVPQPGHEGIRSSESPPSNQLPPAQQRTMVMPDRMRWIYRDPQGNMQGPFSGLEMHDWFKAGFFTAELQVKKLEDVEYEPLAQLVRRIGNSREPFLVPQIGVPHVPASAPNTQWGSAPSASAPNQGPMQPPFASSFPSFGTTLTAEQQNALERRKQEEQYLMARQKEHLAQQQLMMKQYQLGGGPSSIHPALQHHSSAHSLHSQPSFGSITSPQGYQPSPNQAPMQPPTISSLLEGSSRTAAAPNLGQGMSGDFRSTRDDELPGFMERMSLNRANQMPYGSTQLGGQYPEPGAIGTMLEDRARLQAEQQAQDALARYEQGAEQRDNSDRLRHFHTLRGLGDQESHRLEPANPLTASTQSPEAPLAEEAFPQSSPRYLADNRVEAERFDQSHEFFNTVPIQARDGHTADDIEWIQEEGPTISKTSRRETDTPLAAPIAQRNRQNVADELAAGTRSQTQTPNETPTRSIAPWAEKSAGPSKGPSLKEIQEAEERKAEKDEKIADAARKAQAEFERQNAPPPPAPGLPQTSTWATSTTLPPTGPVSSAWSKPAAGKVAAAVPAPAAKKTLAQIQKEEEARKQRQAATAVNVQTTNTSTSVQGKRYAELASKAGTPTPPTGGAWTTVGSGGKVKPPPTVVATPQTGGRTTSGSAAPALVPAKTRSSVQPARSIPSVSSNISSNQAKANEEFLKWARGTLGKGLNNNLNVDEFVQNLLALPPDAEIISDSIYGNSKTLDGHRLAEEFLRRRKLADKGIIDTASNVATTNSNSEPKSGGGWSEIAKKGPPNAGREETNSAFKVVAAKKKGKR
ncbi:MAG: hypothetical protein Q9227_001515 [Pyrenula ochraceoflavens]